MVEKDKTIPSASALAEASEEAAPSIESPMKYAVSSTSTLTELTNITALNPSPRSEKPTTKSFKRTNNPPRSSIPSTLTLISNISALDPAKSPPPPESAATMSEHAMYETFDPKVRPLAWLKFREKDSVTEDEDWGVQIDRGEEMSHGERIRKWVGSVRHQEWDDNDGYDVYEEDLTAGLRSISQ